jgi:hypothetical protein
LKGRIGWGGRIRTSTILINSEVSYRLDHAPAAFGDSDRVGAARMGVDSAAKESSEEYI